MSAKPGSRLPQTSRREWTIQIIGLLRLGAVKQADPKTIIGDRWSAQEIDGVDRRKECDRRPRRYRSRFSVLASSDQGPRYLVESEVTTVLPETSRDTGPDPKLGTSTREEYIGKDSDSGKDGWKCSPMGEWTDESHGWSVVGFLIDWVDWRRARWGWAGVYTR